MRQSTMKISEYLAKRSREQHRASQQFKDFRVFEFNYIPEEPLMRDETKPIIDAAVRFLATEIPNHLFIFGSRGCGKTLMVRYIAGLLESSHQARVHYVNCRRHNTSFKVLAHLLGVQPRGRSQDELWQQFCDSCGKRAIIVLDEIDLLSDTDRRRDILYLLSRSTTGMMAVMLSNHPRFLGTLDESIRSTLQPELIHFRNYNAEQVGAILRERARLGLAKPTWDVLPAIAALTVKNTNSDVRVAIKTLYYLGLEPTENLETVFNRARRDLIADLLADLNDQALLMLMAAVQSQEPFVKAVYERYCQLSHDQHDEPFSYVYFYSNLSYLQSLGLILLISTKVRRAYTNRLQLLFDPDLLRAISRMRFG